VQYMLLLSTFHLWNFQDFQQCFNKASN